jgi:hypothetical protein
MGTKQKGVPLIPSPRYFNPKIEDERKAAKNAKAILAAMSLTPLMKLFQERPRQGAHLSTAFSRSGSGVRRACGGVISSLQVDE